jgi:UDP-N-acetylglucosamine transferase subunit ALG13
MIFVTVGGHMPFDRMVTVVDEWAGARRRTDVFAQIGPTEQHPRNIEWAHFLQPRDFRKKIETARIVVAHAGMGTIITALEFGKPVLVMPRRADLHEHRSQHQFSTAKSLQEQGKIAVAFDEAELRLKLDTLDGMEGTERIASRASSELLEAVRRFIDS